VIVIELCSRTRKKNGDWSGQKALKLTVEPERIASGPGGRGNRRRLCWEARNIIRSTINTIRWLGYRKALPSALALKLIPAIAATGRLRLRAGEAGSKDLSELEWDAGEPWRFRLDVRQGEGEQWTIEGSLCRGEEFMELDQPASVAR